LINFLAGSAVYNGKDGDGIIDDGFKYTGPLRRWNTSSKREVPAHIKRPDYAKNGNFNYLFLRTAKF
jgi:hypothetical protein